MSILYFAWRWRGSRARRDRPGLRRCRRRLRRIRRRPVRGQAHACRRRDAGLDAGVVARRADLGVLGLTTPDGGGTLTTVAAVMEALGAADAPGPFVETFMALQVLGETDVVAVAAGDEIVTVMTSDTIAWLPIASTVIEIDGDRAYRARPAEP